MAWEDEEISHYEDRRNLAARAQSTAEEAKKVLDKEASKRWAELREAFTDKCTELNQKAKRAFITSESIQINELKLDRDRESQLEAHYDPNDDAVRFSVGKNQRFESVFKQMAANAPEGGYKAVWFDPMTKKPIEPSAIVQKILTQLLRT